FQVQRHVTERAPLQPDVGPLTVVQPRHVVRGADVYRTGVEFVRDLRGDGLGLGDLLGLQPLPLQHVLEVHVAAEVELVGPVHDHTAVLEQLGQHPVGDGRTDLRLDVVTDDGHARLCELVGPLGVGGDEHGKRVDKGHTGIDGALGVELVGLLRADREVGHEHVGLGRLEGRHDVHRVLGGLLDRLAVVHAQTVVGRAAQDGQAGRWDVTDLDGVVLTCRDGTGQVLADLLRVHVEGCDELDVAHVVRAELNVHQTGHPRIGGGVLVVMHALDERHRTVADAHDGYTYRTHWFLLLLLREHGSHSARRRTRADADSGFVALFCWSVLWTAAGRVDLFPPSPAVLTARRTRAVRLAPSVVCRGEHVPGWIARLWL